MTTIAHRIHTLPTSLWERIEHALNRRQERLAAAEYRAAIGYDLPIDERAAWLRQAAIDAPEIKHRVTRPAR